MKKILIGLFLVCLLLKPKIVFGQSFGSLDMSLAGINCGVVNGENGSDKCCYQKPQAMPQIPAQDQLQALPLIGGQIANISKQTQALDDLQQKYSNINPCVGNGVPDKDISDPNCRCVAGTAGSPIPQIADMCQKYLKNSNELNTCVSCANKGGMWTGIGCIPLNLSGFVGYLFSFGIGLAGVVAFICIIISAFALQASMGNTEKVKKAQENLTSCIIGLILIIFSIFILRLVGVNILKIPFLS